MNSVEKLIQQLCPKGVEYKKLSEVCLFKSGFAFNSSLFMNTGLPVVRITNIHDNFVDVNDLVYFNPSDYKEDLTGYCINKGDILIAMSGATTGKIGYSTYEDVLYMNQRVGKFIPSSILNNRFLYHYLLSKTKIIYIMAGGGAQPNLSSIKLLNEFYIPIPKIEIQQEIVKILDNFSSLTAELQAELQARKAQYEYYRDKLLTFKNIAE